jgi:hypothetical protein
MPYEEFLIPIFSSIVGGILVAFCNYIWEKQKERAKKENELKERRYLCTILLMSALLDPTELDQLKKLRPDIKNLDDLKRELKTEWVHSWIFADDQTILSLKEFLNRPNEKTFTNTVLSMRKELWNKSSKLTVSEFWLTGFVK